MSEQILKRKLDHLADELSEMSGLLRDDDDSRADSPAERLRRAKCLVEDTARAVGEVVNAAAHQNGAMPGPVAYRVLREKIAA